MINPTSDGLIKADAAVLTRPAATLPHVELTSPALTAMTDFRQEPPAAVSPERHIDDAQRDMIERGVRSLVVMDGAVVVGLVTAADIMGERPVKFLRSPMCDGEPCHRADIRVRDIMTRWSDLSLLDFEWVSRHSVGDIVDALVRGCVTHLLVAQRLEGSTEPLLRGLFSRTRIERAISRTLPAIC